MEKQREITVYFYPFATYKCHKIQPANSGGFPDIWLDDAVFRVVKDVKYDRLMEEERRLFYVALTRARDELFLITELGAESQFIDEIPAAFYAVNKTEFKNVVNPVAVCTTCRTELKEFYKFCPGCGAGR